MGPKLVLLFALIGIASAQFGLPIPHVKPPTSLGSPVGGPGLPEIPDLNVAEWTKKIQDLVELTRSTLVNMGEIAVQDNPEVGARIVTILNGEVAKAAAILTEYTASTLIGGRRRRAVKSGNDAYNGVGDVLVKSNDKIEPEKDKLSPDAKKSINKKHREGVKKCGADSCKAAAKLLAATDDEDERQR